MDHADDDGGDNVFVYVGGSIPRHLRYTITHIRIYESVKIITRGAFRECYNLVSVEMHDGVEIIEVYAFDHCTSLRIIKLPGVRVIGANAFNNCQSLESVEFGDKLERIGESAFAFTSLRHVKLPKIRVIESRAFKSCEQLMEVELSEDLETIGCFVFYNCPFRRITMPLKGNLLGNNYVFNGCDDLSTVHLVGGIHNTISSLLLDSWRDKMNDKIDRINRKLPHTLDRNKTITIRQWMGRVLKRITHYKSKHYALLKEDMTLLELALWKVSLPNVDAAAGRDEARVTCGANIIIPHVLSFLNDEDVFPTINHNS